LAGGALAVLLVNRAGLSWGLFLVGWAAAWALGERLIGARLIGHADMKAIALGVVSGLAFPWAGVLFAWLVQLARP
jgi:hypothetical protein